jgi:hypothetical protein
VHNPIALLEYIDLTSSTPRVLSIARRFIMPPRPINSSKDEKSNVEEEKTPILEARSEKKNKPTIRLAIIEKDR